MRYVVSEIILSTLKDMNPHYPEVTAERLATFNELKKEIEAELPKKSTVISSIPVAQESDKKAKKKAVKEKAVKKTEKKPAKKPEKKKEKKKVSSK